MTMKTLRENFVIYKINGKTLVKGLRVEVLRRRKWGRNSPRIEPEKIGTGQ